MKPEELKSLRDEELIWIKTEIWFPKRCKILFLPCFLGYFSILSTISSSDLCMKMMCTQLDISHGNIFNFVFSDKNSNFKNFVHVGVCSPKVSQKFTKTIVFYPYIMETTLISIWLQVRHNCSSKLLKIFIKSIFWQF